MELLKPAFGLTFWMVLGFLIVLFLLTKFAWKPILNALNERDKSIEDALNAAIKAKDEMANLKADNEKLLAEARQERDKILKEARVTKDNIINEARDKATAEADRLLTLAREGIHNEKMAAITDLKNQVALLSVEIAEKIMKQQLADDGKQKALVADLLKDVKMN
ncbi:MAG TPA: F0F1 ATP synthase subunit B [Bacteroidia bacterium]|jgi:F-type H+-transporting ATPase subunit b|nr:F0F1 ATP synthase subunit B [Bacteroidia bacterium]HMU20117.1 F0F1 ATP synthase subunit B [Bacteroidia bacterium]